MTPFEESSDSLRRPRLAFLLESDLMITERLKWLTTVQPGRFLLPATGLWILALDWGLFSSNALTAGLATPILMLIGFVTGSLGTFFLQRKAAHDSLLKSLAKSLAAGIVVGMPWPIAGTLLGGWILFFAGIGQAPEVTEQDRDEPPRLERSS